VAGGGGRVAGFGSPHLSLTSRHSNAMRKSLVVKLVLVNSMLALSGCRRICEADKDKDQADQPEARAQSSCTGGTSGHGTRGFHYYGWGRGLGWGFSSSSGTSAHTSGSVSRGGFGSTGMAAAS
jgi:hypothetical protein